ncbi:hypothetical protein PG997_008809 [Apiospora hydei]|uniref:NADP-dependent oxidoreductase domain-containing protein n=1 Tax=Apiospora hydei TaxID=1337664 RepID=A0ABR1WEQ9_9PEZI
MASSTPLKAPQLIFGCGPRDEVFPRRADAEELLQTLQDARVRCKDPAAIYPPDIAAAQHRLLGQGQAREYTLDAQVMVSIRKIEKDSTTEGVYRDLQFGEDGKMNVFNALAPDVDIPLREQAAAVHARYKKGLFNKLSVINFPVEMLEEYFEICEREGYVKPTVYQGHYNLIDRRHEGKVMDIVRRHDIAFVAHSPHAGGFLNGRITSGLTADDSMFIRDRVEGSRLDESKFMLKGARRYDTKKHRAAVRALDELLKSRGSGLEKTDVAVRWLAFHSRLGPEDVIMFDGSSIDQIKRTTAAVEQGPLPEDIVSGLDEIWRGLVAA